MNAIEMQYKGPTENKGSRVVTTSQAKRLTVAWNHAEGIEGNMKAAALAHARLMGWAGLWVIGGGTRPGSYVAVCAKAYGFTSGRKERTYRAQVTP